MEVGKFQGIMCPTTPIGSIKIYVCNSRAGFGTSPGIRVYKNRLLYLSFLSLSLSHRRSESLTDYRVPRSSRILSLLFSGGYSPKRNAPII